MVRLPFERNLSNFAWFPSNSIFSVHANAERIASCDITEKAQTFQQRQPHSI
jgi:hypothetical protein